MSLAADRSDGQLLARLNQGEVMERGEITGITGGTVLGYGLYQSSRFGDQEYVGMLSLNKYLES